MESSRTSYLICLYIPPTKLPLYLNQRPKPTRRTHDVSVHNFFSSFYGISAQVLSKMMKIAQIKITLMTTMALGLFLLLAVSTTAFAPTTTRSSVPVGLLKNKECRSSLFMSAVAEPSAAETSEGLAVESIR
jgi:hypothetical protein